ncbi:MAG: hypothetical protein IJ243_05385 [Prevotella sp.]|nr:hypothetical protein [Prevotella sp.]
MKHVSEIISGVMAECPKPILTGLQQLDEQIGGYYPSELTTVCGRENVGKTAFIVHQVNRLAVDMGVATYLYAGYVDERVWLSMMVAYYCGIQTIDFHSVLYSPKYATPVKEYLEKLKKAPLFVEFGMEQSFSIDHVMDVVKRENIRIAFFDDANWLTEENRALKRVAVACRIPVVASAETWLHEREGMDGRRPMLSDLEMVTGGYGSDVVIGLTDFETDHIFMDENGRSLRGILELSILKHKGMMKLSRIRIRKTMLYAKELSGEDAMLYLEKTLEQNPHVSSLVDKLGLQMD